jgi:hypothetical protein
VCAFGKRPDRLHIPTQSRRPAPSKPLTRDLHPSRGIVIVFDIAANCFFTNAIEFRPPHRAFILEQDIRKGRALTARIIVIGNRFRTLGHFAISGRRVLTIPTDVTPTKMELRCVVRGKMP